jgi:TonB family protein
VIGIVVKGTILLAAAFWAAALLRRRSAAQRHFVWTAAFGALLLLPVVAQVHLSVANDLRVNVPAPVSAAPVEDTRLVIRAGHGPALQVPWAPIVYAAGFAVAAARFLVGVAHTARLVRRGVAAPDLGSDVVIAQQAPMPLARGILRPMVVLPEAAREWPQARLRSVLLHERMHHERRDLLAQAIGQAACCLFWFHPLAWLALARQRAERERACDDAVLRQGIGAHDYAGHLMEVVRAAAGQRASWADTPAMAETSNLEARVRALLDGTRDRRPLTAARASLIVVAVAAILVPLAAIELRAQPGGGTLTGTVKDPSGAVVPGCTVRVKDSGGSTQGSATTNMVGLYRVPGLAGGQYTLEFAMPGFVTGKALVTLVGGATVQTDFNLTLGEVREVVTATGKKSAPVMPKPQVSTPARIAVGGNVQAAKLIRQPRPIYPAELQAAGVEGTVMLQAIIGKDGSVIGLRVIKSAGNTALDDAAVASVKQWQYQPTLLNGQPVETLTTIDVNFELDQ